ncbi:amino acid transporter, partial [Ramicandelaber brevisporus]
EQQLQQTMGPFAAMNMVTGLMVGSAIYCAPGHVAALVGGPTTAMIVWAVGALLTGAGAMAYVELGSMFPTSGGEFEYLKHAFPYPRGLLSLLFSFAMITCIRPARGAAISMVFAEYLYYALKGPSDHGQRADSAVSQQWIERGLAIACITVVSIVNALSVRWALRLNTLLGVIKSLVLAIIAISGIVVLTGVTSIPRQLGNWDLAKAATLRDTSQGEIGPRNIASALFKVMFAFEGWNNLNYSLGELKNPQRNLPIAVGGGVVMTAMLYILANAAYFSIIPLAEIYSSNDILAGIYCEIVFGKVVGRVILPVCVSISCLGAVSAGVFGVSRIIVAAAKEGYLPLSHQLGHISERFGTPLAAVVLNYVLTVAFIVLPPPGEAFRLLVDIQSYPTWCFYGITVIGLLVMRAKKPSIPRPFKAAISVALLFVITAILLCTLPFLPPVKARSSSVPYFTAPLIGAIYVVL